MSTMNKINEQLKVAMKSKNVKVLSALRMLKADIIMEAKRVRISEDKLDESIIISVVQRTLKKYKEELSYIKDESKIKILEQDIELFETYQHN